MPKKILLADDSITIQKVVELTFSEGDYQVFAVGNGSLALRKIHEVRPDIALLDVIMPEANGYEVCEKVKRDPETSRIPVLLLTGTFEPFDRKRAESVGADGHLTKPFESQVLISKVEELIATALPAVPEAPRPEMNEPAVREEAPFSRGEKLADAPAATRMVHEEVSTNGIVPDRYDDFLARAQAGAGSEAGDSISQRPSAEALSDADEILPAHDPMAETWDELASGLSAAPEGSRSAIERSTSSNQEVTFLAVDDGPSRDPGVPAEPMASPVTPQAEPVSLPAGREMTVEQMDRIASQVVERLSDRVVREIAWEVIPEIAETLIRQRIRELEEKIAREG